MCSCMFGLFVTAFHFYVFAVVFLRFWKETATSSGCFYFFSLLSLPVNYSGLSTEAWTTCLLLAWSSHPKTRNALSIPSFLWKMGVQWPLTRGKTLVICIFIYVTESQSTSREIKLPWLLCECTLSFQYLWAIYFYQYRIPTSDKILNTFRTLNVHLFN